MAVSVLYCENVIDTTLEIWLKSSYRFPWLFPQLLLCSLYKIYEALEEELDRNASHESVTPIYFPQELARLEALKKDLEHFYGQDWREKMIVPAATLRYAQRLREVLNKI